MTNEKRENQTPESGKSESGKPAERGRLPDVWLFCLTLTLVGVGITLVFDASYAHALEYYGSAYYWVARQIAGAMIGLAGMLIVMRIPHWKLRGWAWPALLLCIALLTVTLVMGRNVQGGQRWVGFGPVQIQPSEFVKVALVLFLARILTDKPRLLRDFWGGVVPLLLVCLVPILLVEFQPDLGTAITLILLMLLMFFAAGVPRRWLVGLLVFFAIAGVGMALRHEGTEGYRWKRMVTFLHPDQDRQGNAYQVYRARVALTSGGLTGVGFGEGREKRRNLPAQRTDFIFAVLGEELGLVGTAGVLLLFMLLTARGLHIAWVTKDPFGALLAVGVTGMISLQALLNIAVVTASIPTTGVPLPFLSLGGSSLASTLIGLGIVLSVSRHPNYRDPRVVHRELRAAWKDR